MTEQGFRLFLQAGQKGEWTPCPLPPLTESLVTLPVYRRRHQLGSNTSAMNILLRRGAVRIKLGSRSFWWEPQNGFTCPVSVPADADLTP